MKRNKFKILLIPDFKNWAYDNRSGYIQKYLGKYYNFDKIIGEDIKNVPFEKRDAMIDWMSYDLIYVFYWRFFRDLEYYPPCRAMATGVFSHDSWAGEKKELFQELKKYVGVGVNTKILFKELKDVHSDLVYIPNGVETDKFRPKKINRSENFTVGWVGYPDRGGETDAKGFYTVIKPAVEKIDNIEFLTSLRGLSETPHDEMPDFYNKLDVYVCASESEGFCNPVVEAMSCGVPVISTAVGISKQIIKNGKNGILIKRNEQELIRAIEKLRNNKKLRIKLSKNARKTALQFSYERIMKKHKKFFDLCIKNANRNRPSI
ncbi:glycosyltransferase [Candidatus Falkowbacteria bacterium]|nr:glycosyltransferase [Candidatus Falkowbacteria bacterium]